MRRVENTAVARNHKTNDGRPPAQGEGHRHQSGGPWDLSLYLSLSQYHESMNYDRTMNDLSISIMTNWGPWNLKTVLLPVIRCTLQPISSD